MVTFNLEILTRCVAILNFLSCYGIKVFENIWFEFVLILCYLDFFLCESFGFSEIVFVFLICDFDEFASFLFRDFFTFI